MTDKVDPRAAKARPEWSRDAAYRALLNHALLRLVFLYFIPLLLLTVFFHIQYRLVARDAERRHLQAMADHQPAMLDLFLGEIEPAGFMRHRSEPYIEPLNHAHVYAAAMIYCRRHVPGQRRRARYEAAVRKISAFYRSAIRVGPDGGLSWAYMPRLDAPTTGRAEGFWKASVTVELPIAGRKEAFLFTRKDIAGIAVTVRSLDRNGRIAQFFDSREPFLVKDKRFAGSSLSGQLAVFYDRRQHRA